MKFPELDEHIAWVTCILVWLIIVFVFFIGLFFDSLAEQYNHCKQAGGVFVAARYNYVCLRRDAVIEMKEVE